MKRIVPILAGCLLLIGGATWAGTNYDTPSTGEELGRLCAAVPTVLIAKEPTFDDVMKSQVCLVYIQASLDGFELMALALKRRKPFCLPEGTLDLDRVNAIVRWLAVHPEEKKLHAATVVVTALASAFPCK